MAKVAGARLPSKSAPDPRRMIESDLFAHTGKRAPPDG